MVCFTPTARVVGLPYRIVSYYASVLLFTRLSYQLHMGVDHPVKDTWALISDYLFDL